jgi:hypothetical protein
VSSYARDREIGLLTGEFIASLVEGESSRGRQLDAFAVVSRQEVGRGPAKGTGQQHKLAELELSGALFESGNHRPGPVEARLSAVTRDFVLAPVAAQPSDIPPNDLT